jgi:hypothetical protein
METRSILVPILRSEQNSPIAPELPPPCSATFVPQSHCRPLAWRSNTTIHRKHRPVKVFGQVPPVRVRHRPHRADHAAETRVLHRGSKMQGFVWIFDIRQLRRMTGREEGKLRGG